MKYGSTPPTKSQAKPRFESRNNPGKCPACGSERITLIVYCLIPDDPEILKLHKEGLLHFEHSFVTGDDPRWLCKSCDATIYKSPLPY